MKPATFFLPLLLVPIAGFPGPFPSAPDVLPPGTHGVHFLATIDAGAYASCLFRSYVIAKGDTLDAIARRECGDVRSSEEIRLLNPDAIPGMLEPGARIVIPPSAAAASRPAEGAHTGWVLFLRSWSFFGARPPVPLVGGQVSTSFRGQAAVIAVPREKLEWFLGLHWRSIGPTSALEGVIRSDPIAATDCVPEGDPVWKVEARIALRDIKDGRVAIDVTERRFGKDGKLLSEKKGQEGAGEPRRGGMSLPLAVIGIGALLGVVGIARRRRTRT